MPRLNTSIHVRSRVITLLNTLARGANATCDVPPGMTVGWVDTSSTALMVTGQLRDLIALVYGRESTPALKEQIRNDLRVLERLGFLQDNRDRKQGAKHWQFTLTLWSRTDLALNAEKVSEAIAEFKKSRRQKTAQNQASSVESSSHGA